MMKMKTYKELMRLSTFEERFEYLNLAGRVGIETFGYDRYLNQMFYGSDEWRSLRDEIIVRDNGCDLSVDGYTIHGKIYIHHMNPITKDDILQHSDSLVNPDYLICVSFATHNAIHYGNDNFVTRNQVIERRRNDTCPWRN